MTSLYKHFKMDESLENEGVWFTDSEFPLNSGGNPPQFKLARMSRGNKAYQKAMMAFAEEHDRALKHGTLKDDVAFDAMITIFATTILVDWREIEGANGTLIPYSHEAAERLLRDLPEIYAMLEEVAKSREHFRQSVVEDDAGN